MRMIWFNKKEVNIDLAEKLAIASIRMASFASSSTTVKDWNFFAEIAIQQGNRALCLYGEKETLTLNTLTNSPELLMLPDYRAANLQYQRLMKNTS